MNIVKKIGLWIVVVFLAFIVLGTIPSIACVTALLIALLVAPIEKWQNFLRRYIKGKIKVIIIFILAIAMLLTFPVSDVSTNSDMSNTTTTTSTTGETTTIASVVTTPASSSVTTNDLTATTTVKTTPVTAENLTKTTVATTTEIRTTTATVKTTQRTTTSRITTTTTECEMSTSEIETTTIATTTKTTIVTEKEEVVWIPASKKGKYHCKKDCSGMKNPIEMKKSEAIHQGYEPCSRCY